MSTRTDTAPSPLERDADVVGDALAVIIRRSNLPRLHDRLAASAGVALDRAGFVVLSRLHDAGGLRLSELAERLGTDVSTVSRQVAALERAGLVERTPDPHDRRATRLAPTEAGVDAYLRLRAARRRALAAVLEHWDEGERAALAALLDRFAADFLLYAGEL